MTTSNEAQAAARGRRHLFTGIVVSDKVDKMRVVTVQSFARHAKYEKIVRRRSKFYAHDEKNESRAGDLVEIAATRPMSKLKRWRLVRVVKAAARAQAGPSAEVAA